MVVYYICEIVCRQPVSLYKHAVIKGVAGGFYIAEKQILKRCHAFCGYVLPYAVAFAAFHASFCFFFRDIKTMLVIFPALAFACGFFAAGIKLLNGAEARVGIAGFNELKRVGEVCILPFRLYVGTIGTTNIRPFIVD